MKWLVLVVALFAVACSETADRAAPLAPAPPVAAMIDANEVVAVFASEESGIAEAAQQAVGALRRQGFPVARALSVEAVEPEGDVVEMIDAVDGLLHNDPVLMLVGCDREAAMTAARLAAANDVLVMSPCATTPDLTDGRSPVFGLAARNRPQGLRLAELALERGYGSAITVSDADSTDGFEACNRFETRFRRTGDLLTTIELSATTGIDMLERFNDPAVVVACFDADVAADRIAAIRSTGYGGPILATSGAIDVRDDVSLGVVASVGKRGEWSTTAATRAAVKIFGGASRSAESISGASLATVIDGTQEFETPMGVVRFESRANVSPVRVRPAAEGQ